MNLDPDVLSAARQIALASSRSIGEVISELVRRGLEYRSQTVERHGFPVFAVRDGAPPLTDEDVRRGEDEG